MKAMNLRNLISFDTAAWMSAFDIASSQYVIMILIIPRLQDEVWIRNSTDQLFQSDSRLRFQMMVH